MFRYSNKTPMRGYAAMLWHDQAQLRPMEILDVKLPSTQGVVSLKSEAGLSIETDCYRWSLKPPLAGRLGFHAPAEPADHETIQHVTNLLQRMPAAVDVLLISFAPWSNFPYA